MSLKDSQWINQRGRMHVHFHPKRARGRLRFTSVHRDQATTIAHALEKARAEAGTPFDIVALEMICIGYLGSSVAAPRSSAKTT